RARRARLIQPPPAPGGGRGGGGPPSPPPGGVSHGPPPWWVPPPLARSFPQQPPGALAQHRHRFGGGLLRVDASFVGRAAGPCPGMGSDSFLLLGGLDSERLDAEPPGVPAQQPDARA